MPKVTLALPWQKGHRLIPSKFPPVDLYETVLDPDDLELAWALEAITNPRLRDEAGDLGLIKKEDRVSGTGSSPIMAAFTHVGNYSRFTDGSYGVYYAASNISTAIAETRFHKERFLRATREGDTRITMREYISQTLTPLHDIRALTEFHNPDLSTYPTCQKMAVQIREKGSDGLLYNSVRNPGGECIAIFKPIAIKVPVIQAGHYDYIFNGNQQCITDIVKLASVA